MKINWFKISKRSLFEKLKVLLLDKYFQDWNIFLYYLKIGEICKDCNEMYYMCFCNIHNNYNITKQRLYSSILNFISNNLNQKDIIYTIRLIQTTLCHFGESIKSYEYIINDLKNLYENKLV